MNPGIFTSGYEPPPMPRDLLGAPTPVPTVATRIFNPDNLVLVLDTNREVNNNVTLHIVTDAANDLTIDWGDGTTSRQVGSGTPTKTYSQKGVYVVQVSGRLNAFGSGVTASKPKVVECLSFGNLGLTSLSSGLRSYTNLTRVPSRLPPAVTSLSSMFQFSSSFNYPIGSWNTAAVTSMSSMFQSATSFNQPIGSWNTAAVTNMLSMFQSATSFNQPIGGWNTAAVTTFRGMFTGAASFNQPIGSWNTSAVTDFSGMFNGATSFNQPIGSWNTAAVTNMLSMFNGASSFNQPIGGWNTAAVTLMNFMFQNASSFNQDISSWNIAAVTSMVTMFSGNTWGRANYDAALIAWSQQNVQNNVTAGFGTNQYSAGAAAAARAVLVGKGWIITDGGQAP